jgi:hypothetical protein
MFRPRLLRRAAAIGAVALVPLLLPAGALAQKIIGVVQGHLHLENPVWAEAKDTKAKGYSFREMVPTVPAKFRKLYPHLPKEVCVAALAETPQKPDAMATLVRVGGGRTTPVTIVVVPGTKLVFQNTDPFTHRLYGVGMPAFGPSDTSRGGTREWTVPGPGKFEIRDELAPSLRMWVVGEPNVAKITYPTMKGEFFLNVETPGNYSVQAYFAGEKAGAATAAVVDTADVKVAPLVIGTPQKKTGDD